MAGKRAKAPAQELPDADVWRNRIVEHRDVAPGELLANPFNFRVHPSMQQDAMKAALGRLGWISSVKVNRRTGHVIDGHMRVALAIQEKRETIPVEYVDLDEDEERLALATFDPISALALEDGAMVRELLDGLQVDDALRVILDDLQKAIPVEPEPPATFVRFSGALETAYCCPRCGFEWNGDPKPGKVAAE